MTLLQPWHWLTQALPMVSWSMADLLVRSTLLLAMAIGVRQLLRHQSAAVRHFVGLLVIATVVALPLTLTLMPPGMGLLPSWTVVPGGSSAAGATPWWTAASWLATIWALGAAYVLARLARGRRFLAQAFARSAALPGQAEALRAAAATHGLGRTITVRTSNEVDVPLAFGIRRPSILLPASAAQWSSERLELVLLHETAHLRRFDQATHLLGALLTALFWFHPLAWVASRQLALDREHACDDLVLHARGDANGYARQLVAIAEALAGKRPPVLAVSMARPSQLRQRLTALLDQSRDRRGLRPRDTAVGLTLVALLFASVGARGLGTGDASRSASSDERLEAEAANGHESGHRSGHRGAQVEETERGTRGGFAGGHDSGAGHPSGRHDSEGFAGADEGPSAAGHTMRRGHGGHEGRADDP